MTTVIMTSDGATFHSEESAALYEEMLTAIERYRVQRDPTEKALYLCCVGYGGHILYKPFAVPENPNVRTTI